mmetsp:Transcript_32277/g.79974  ORF Transcript_32277/g.79974 Transcript_32277/m.79974 type:complete len:100 (-) Transcript_32277:144-443(-)
MGKSMGVEPGEGGPRVLLHVAVGVQMPFGGCVRRAGARAGAADMPVECPGLCVVCAQCCMCSAILCSCVFVAWGMLGTGSPMGIRDAGPGFACVRAWRR